MVIVPGLPRSMQFLALNSLVGLAAACWPVTIFMTFLTWLYRVDEWVAMHHYLLLATSLTMANGFGAMIRDQDHAGEILLGGIISGFSLVIAAFFLFLIVCVLAQWYRLMKARKQQLSYDPEIAVPRHQVVTHPNGDICLGMTRDMHN